MKSHPVTLLIVLGFVFFTIVPSGLFMLVRPDANMVHLSWSVLSYSIFKKYFMLNFFLCVALGCISLIAFFRVMQNKLNASEWCYLDAIMLFCWIAIAISLAGGLNWLHVVYVAAGIFMVLLASRFEGNNKYLK